jgi:hypothetical protein
MGKSKVAKVAKYARHLHLAILATLLGELVLKVGDLDLATLATLPAILATLKR